MNFLVFDTETNGLCDMKKADKDPAQPHLVQLALLFMDDTGKELSHANIIVRPEGWTISPEMEAIHGISHGLALRVGIPLRIAVALYANYRGLADATVAHNSPFDTKVMDIAMAQCNVTASHPGPKRKIDTAEESAILVGLPPTDSMKRWPKLANKNKTPNLQELHTFLFGDGFEGGHDAMVDVRACAKCLLELRRRGACL